MKRTITIILIMLMLTFVLNSCKEDETWREKEIYGSYESLNNDNEKFEKNSAVFLENKTFILETNLIEYTDKKQEKIKTITNSYSYGTYKVTKKIEKENYIEYILKLYFTRQEDEAFSYFNEFSIEITKGDTIFSKYNGKKLTKTTDNETIVYNGGIGQIGGAIVQRPNTNNAKLEHLSIIIENNEEEKTITITAKKDISNLILRMEFYEENNFLEEYIKVIGNIKNGEEITFKINKNNISSKTFYKHDYTRFFIHTGKIK